MVAIACVCQPNAGFDVTVPCVLDNNSKLDMHLSGYYAACGQVQLRCTNGVDVQRYCNAKCFMYHFDLKPRTMEYQSVQNLNRTSVDRAHHDVLKKKEYYLIFYPCMFVIVFFLLFAYQPSSQRCILHTRKSIQNRRTKTTKQRVHSLTGHACKCSHACMQHCRKRSSLLLLSAVSTVV